MKVVLINCPITFNSHDNDCPPLGLGIIKGCLLRHGYDVEIIDLNIRKYDPSELRGDAFGLSFTTASYRNAKKIIGDLKALRKPIILGGPHASALPERTLKETECDVVVVGEGETILPKILSDLPYFSGVQKGYYTNDLDALPFASQHLPMNEYRNLCLSSSRGCPYRCIFCFNSKRHSPVRFRSAENVVEELVYMVDEYGNEKPFWFVDDHLTLDRRRLLTICDLIIDEELEINWFCNSRVDAVDRECLEAMSEAGCFKIVYGIETGSPETMRKINKGITFAQIEKAIELTKSAGIKAKGGFIIGFPWETEKHIKKTLDFARSLKLDEYSFYFATPFPGTLLWDYWIEPGFSLKVLNDKNVPWSAFTLRQPIFTNKLSFDYLTMILENAEFYARHNLRYSLSHLRRCSDKLFALRLMLT